MKSEIPPSSTIDSSLSSTSENPVQNKVIQSALAGKSDTNHTHNQYLTSHQDISGKLDKAQGSSNASKNVVTDTNGYITTEAKPTIPTKVSDLTNDSNYVTTSDSRLSDARTPTSHTHGDITNDGKIGSTANKPIITTTNGKLTTGSFGTSANTFCQGNDSRLSDARTPTSHTHGSLTNDGKIGSASGIIITTGTNGALQASDSITKSMISDFPSSMAPSSHEHNATEVKDSSAYTNIGSSANATQHTINDKVNTALGNKANSSNVYSKSETYTQSEIITLISNAVSDLDLFEVVTSLPTTNIKDNRLYLIANSENITNDAYDVYLRVNNAWERLDDFSLGITNYYKKTEVDTLLEGKVDNTDSRLTDSRTPKSHTHGNITNTGAVGSTANKPLITTTNGVVTTGSFGTSANTFCQGNDSRLSDARTPTSHSHGSLANGGTLNSDITSVNKIAVTDSSNNLKTIGSLPYSKLSGTPTIPSKTSDLTNDSGFLTSHQDISGKIDTAGSGLSKSGTTLNHSNSVTALTTASFKKVKYDAQGHITGTSDVSKSDITGLGIPSSDTTYSAEKGITLSSGKFGHSNTAITAQTTSALKKIKYDSYGHITGTDNVSANDLPSHGHTLDDVQLYDPMTGNPVFGYDGAGYLYALNDSIYIDTNTDNIPYLSSSNSPIASIDDIPTNNNQLTNGAGYITSSAISGKIDTAGTGLSKSGTTLNHSNSITAVTTATFKKIKYDAQGHITGTADVAASDLPSHTHSQYALSTDIPSSTSGLTNDGEDGINPFVSDDDSRLSDARTPTSHTHGNLTNDGKVGSTENYFVYTTTGGAITSKQKIGNITTSGAIGSTSGLPLKTTTSGVITTGSFGTTSGTFCQGNDSRLHSHTFTYSGGTLTIS